MCALIMANATTHQAGMSATAMKGTSVTALLARILTNVPPTIHVMLMLHAQIHLGHSRAHAIKDTKGMV